jgi:hypothetical protein
MVSFTFIKITLSSLGFTWDQALFFKPGHSDFTGHRILQRERLLDWDPELRFRPLMA